MSSMLLNCIDTQVNVIVWCDYEIISFLFLKPVLFGTEMLLIMLNIRPMDCTDVSFLSYCSIIFQVCASILP